MPPVEPTITEMLQDPEEAVRLLKLLEYTDDEIAEGIVTQYGLTEDDARALVAA